MEPAEHQTLLEVHGVSKYFPMRRSLLRSPTRYVRAVDGVTFAIRRGESMGLVGESGCGKTTLARLIAGAYSPTGGTIRLCLADGRTIQAGSLRGRAKRQYLREVQMIFQDPYSSLNPRRTVMQIIEEPLICLTDMKPEDRKERVLHLLEVVGLDRRHAERYPHAFSGGQRQRIGIARALAIAPSLLICDEPVSALDVSVRGQIINLLMDLQAALGLTYLFISHDLGVVRHICDRAAVMYVGKLVEIASTQELFSTPKHPYTEALLSAVPRPDPRTPITAMVLEGDVADPANRPSGCCFHPRCRYAQDLCRAKEPVFTKIESPAGGHYSACHFADAFSLRGVPQ